MILFHSFLFIFLLGNSIFYYGKKARWTFSPWPTFWSHWTINGKIFLFSIFYKQSWNIINSLPFGLLLEEILKQLLYSITLGHLLKAEHIELLWKIRFQEECHLGETLFFWWRGVRGVIWVFVANPACSLLRSPTLWSGSMHRSRVWSRQMDVSWKTFFFCLGASLRIKWLLKSQKANNIISPQKKTWLLEKH